MNRLWQCVWHGRVRRYFQSCHGKGPSDGLGATYKSGMTAAELRGHYMADTLTAFRWLQQKFKKKKEQRKKKKHAVKEHTFYYVPQQGEKAEGANILPELDRKRQADMVGGAGMQTMGHFDFRATGTVGSVQMRWLSHSCAACLRGCYGECDKQKAQASDNVAKQLLVQEASYSGAAAGKAALRERVDEVKGKLAVGQIVALFTGGGEFALAKIVQLPRKAKVGEMVVGHRAVHGNSWVVEVDWSSGVAGSTAQGSRKFKFEVGDMCGKTECMCGSALNCTKRHSHLAYVDSVLPPLELGMVKEGSSSRRLRKRQKQQQQATNKPEFWVLPPGSKQELMRTMAADIEAGVTYTRHT